MLTRATGPELAWAAGEVNRLLLAGRLAARGIHVLPLADAASAHHLVEAGTAHAKVVLVP